MQAMVLYHFFTNSPWEKSPSNLMIPNDSKKAAGTCAETLGHPIFNPFMYINYILVYYVYEYVIYVFVEVTGIKHTEHTYIYVYIYIDI